MRFLLILFVCTLILPAALAVNATVVTSPASNATTVQTLHCLVTGAGSGTLQANITWYLNGTMHPSDNETLNLTSGIQESTTSIGAIEPADTSKDDTWICQATIYNGSETNTTNATTITIQNSAPVVTSPITTQAATEDSAFGPVVATATDPDGDPIVAWISSDLNASDYGGTPLFTIASDGTISFTPLAAAVGNHTMALLASDGQLFGGRNVLWTVAEFNDPPTIVSIADQSATEGDVWSYTLNGTDEEGDLFNWSISSNIPELIITQLNASQSYLNFTTGAIQFSHGGVHNITVVIYEVGDASKNTTYNFTLNISTTNRAPVFGTLPNVTSTQGSSISLNFTATDNDTTDTINFSITAYCDTPSIWNIDTINDSYLGAIGNISVGTLTNDHVACRNVNISATDYESGSAKNTTSINYTINITNTNDAPTVHNISYSGSNYLGQRNLSNILGATGQVFTYQVNATDPDSSTYEGEVLTYADDSALFVINSTSGLIQFTPTNSSAGNHSINITVSDDGGLNHTETMNLNIVTNVAPVLTLEPSLTCQEDANCTATLEANDADAGANLTFSVSILNYSLTTNATVNTTWNLIQNGSNMSTIWKVFTNTMVGNYTYNITVVDEYSAQDSQIWNVTVNNTNDAPFFDQNNDSTTDNVTFPDPVVENFLVNFTINVTDVDFINVQENLTLLTNITGPNTSLFTPTKVGARQWRVQFTPNLVANGNYSVNFTVVDDSGASDTQIVNFTVYNQSNVPTIDEIQPFYNSTLGTTEHYLTAESPFNGFTNVSVSEGLTYVYNISWTDNDTAPANVTVEWAVNGTVVQTTAGTADPSYSVTYGYFDAGSYQYVVTVTDDRLGSDTFTWNVTVVNVNRAPQLIANISDRNVNQTITLLTYMSVFYDPDDDLDSNGQIDGSEESNLSYTSTTSSLLSITFAGEATTLEPLSDGTAYITYTATDAEGSSINSNNVTYNVTAPPEDTSSSSSGSSSSASSSTAGGGGSSAFPFPIPISEDTEYEVIDILTPSPITIYYNDTIEVPIMISNPTDRTLRNTVLSAEAGVGNVTFTWSQDTIDILEPNHKKNLSLFITNYRTDGTYEVKVIAKVEDPDINDSAVIFINSLEAGSDGEAVQTKVTFARDLLTANPECLELNELLEQAQRAIETNQQAEAQNLINTVIDGCRYLVTQEASREEVPGGIDISQLIRFRYANYVLAGLLIVLVGVGALLFTHYYSSAKQEKEN